MPTPHATALIEKALSSCLGNNAPAVHRVLEDVIANLHGQSFEDLHEVCEPRGGFNLGSMATQYLDGWSGRNFKAFRQMVSKGYNPNIADKGGRMPSFKALESDRVWMHVSDFQWAFAHQLNPLAFYADTFSGQSLLSVDFTQARGAEIVRHLSGVLQDRLSLMDTSSRDDALGMLRATALPCYGNMLARIGRDLLDRSTPIPPASIPTAPRF